MDAALTLRIDPRFQGPDNSGNGGYTAGRLAAALGPATGQWVEVTLRRPPPLERLLVIERVLAGASNTARLLDGAVEIATARLPPPEDLAGLTPLSPPSPPSFAEAQALSVRYLGHHRHGFPRCFACGPGRAPGDGLRIFPGRTGASGPVAAPFVPGADLAGPDRRLGPEMIWAALDCVGYFGVAEDRPENPTPPALLGRMTAALLGPLSAGVPCVVVGWGLGGERRKLYAGSALYAQEPAGPRLVGLSRQVWITV